MSSDYNVQCVLNQEKLIHRPLQLEEKMWGTIRLMQLVVTSVAFLIEARFHSAR
jgi:hypothetical protein